MTIEEARERRGEPVRFTKCGHTYVGTIEFGDDERGYVVCTEPAGARLRVAADDLVADRGGERPLWKRREKETV